jgi:hypothetical protein
MMGANIIYAGRVHFGQASSHPVTFTKPVNTDFVVVVTGDGSSAGAIARSIETFSVTKRSSAGFTIESSNNNSRQVVDYIVVIP